MASTQTTATVVVKNGKPSLAIVTPSQAVLPPAMVTKAKRGAELQAILKSAKDELDGLKSDFEAFFLLNDTHDAYNAGGKIVAIRTHGEPRRLNLGMLKAAHPAIVEEFTFAEPWDSVSFKA